jgi:predicted outer membrane repeat protein
MEWPSVMLKILIVKIFLLFFAKISYSRTVNYVKPFASERTSPCSDMQRPCLTLNEYASNSDEYFVNNTTFYFYPGIHRLDYSLILVNLYNFSFLGRPNGDQVVTIAVDSLASITWNKSWNIEISSIRFTLHDDFTFIMRFEHSRLLRLFNTSINGNRYSGCSSVISEESSIEFNDSTFIGINGFLGAALMIFESNITFRGSILFAGNTATSGGSIYLTHNSTLTLNGTSLFQNNTSNFTEEVIYNKKMLSCNYINSMREIKLNQILLYNGGGGAIVCNNSYL